jgi:hypothetical protein
MPIVSGFGPLVSLAIISLIRRREDGFFVLLEKRKKSLAKLFE